MVIGHAPSPVRSAPGCVGWVAVSFLPCDRRALTVCLAAVAAVYLPVLGFEFVSWDDPVYVRDNPLLHGRGGLRQWLLTPELGYPIPVTVATYRLEVALFGFSAAAMHSTNLLLHLACVAGVYAVGRRLGLGWPGAAMAAAVFGLHPAAAEPVSWVTGRKELLACLGCLAATGLALGRRPGESSAAFALALLSKPVAAFLPAFELLRRWRVDREPLASALRGSALQFAAVAVVVPLSWLGLRGIEEAAAPRSLGGVLRESWYALGHAVGLLVGAIAPCAVQQPPAVPPPWDPAIDLAPLVVFPVLALAARGLRASPRPALLGALWALLAWLPASNLLPLSRYLADSYVYLPGVGVAWFLGALGDAVWRSRSLRPGFAVVVGVALLLLAGSARTSSARWQDSAALWEHTAAARPDDPRACRNAGNAWLAAEQPERALARYLACEERHGREDVDKNIAITLCVLKRWAEAKPRLERLATSRPDDATVRKYLDGVDRALARPGTGAPK